MNRFWSKSLSSIKPYTPGEQPKEKLIKLNTNENPYPPAPAVLSAIDEAKDHLRLYPPPESDGLAATLAAYHKVDKNMIFCGNGSDEVLALAYLAFFHDRGVIAPDISYSFYPVYAKMFDVEYHTIQLSEDFCIDAAKMNGLGKGVIFANPNAPTSLFMPVAQIEQILIQNPDAVVLVDEAYIDFGGETCIQLLDKYENLLVTRTFSKSHSLAGLRVGYAVGQEGLIEALYIVKNSFNSYPLDILAQAGAKAAINALDYYSHTKAKIISTRRNAANRMRAMGFNVLPASANFIFAEHPEMPAKLLLDELRSRKILVRHFNLPRIENFLRISIGTDDEMEAFFRALSDIFTR